jgi:DNA-binding winged helix-turn-helix (wHTH) protein
MERASMPLEKVQLGQFVLDLSRYELTRTGTPVRLERIPMDLLILLVREGGRLVSREEIIERLWDKDVHFDTDNGINTAIRKIRRALGEDPEKPQFIETVPGRGYRLKMPFESAMGMVNRYTSSTYERMDRDGRLTIPKSCTRICSLTVPRKSVWSPGQEAVRKLSSRTISTWGIQTGCQTKNPSFLQNLTDWEKEHFINWI